MAYGHTVNPSRNQWGGWTNPGGSQWDGGNVQWGGGTGGGGFGTGGGQVPNTPIATPPVQPPVNGGNGPGNVGTSSNTQTPTPAGGTPLLTVNGQGLGNYVDPFADIKAWDTDKKIAHMRTLGSPAEQYRWARQAGISDSTPGADGFSFRERIKKDLFNNDWSKNANWTNSFGQNSVGSLYSKPLTDADKAVDPNDWGLGFADGRNGGLTPADGSGVNAPPVSLNRNVRRGGPAPYTPPSYTPTPTQPNGTSIRRTPDPRLWGGGSGRVPVASGAPPPIITNPTVTPPLPQTRGGYENENWFNIQNQYAGHQ